MSRQGWSATNFLRLGSAVVTATPFTMACWARTSIVGAATSQLLMGLFNSASTSNINSFQLEVVVTTNTIGFQAADGAAASEAVTTTSIAANTWFHACGVSASATSRSVYLNGGSKSTGATSRVPAGLNRTSVGLQDNTAANKAFAVGGTGDIAEVAIWNTALSDADVARHATGIDAIAIQREFLVGLWRLDGGGLTEVNVINPSQPMVVQGALSLSAPPPKFFMPVTPRQSRFFRQ